MVGDSCVVLGKVLYIIHFLVAQNHSESFIDENLSLSIVEAKEYFTSKEDDGNYLHLLQTCEAHTNLMNDFEALPPFFVVELYCKRRCEQKALRYNALMVVYVLYNYQKMLRCRKQFFQSSNSVLY